MQASKEPFEKIRSLVERRKLFEELLNRQDEAVFKSDGDALFTFVPTVVVHSQKLQFGQQAVALGQVCGLDGLSAEKTINILGHFSIEPDRYFFKGVLRHVGVNRDGVAIYELDSETEVFRFQRRKTFRVSLPASYPIFFRTKSIDDQAHVVDVQLTDLSIGGMKVFHATLDLPLQMESTLFGALYPQSGKEVSLTGKVRHIQDQLIEGLGKTCKLFGIEFVEPSQVIKNRLTALTLEIQHKIVTSYK